MFLDSKQNIYHFKPILFYLNQIIFCCVVVVHLHHNIKIQDYV